MYNVSNEFITAAKGTPREVVGYITLGDTIYDDEVKSINPSIQSADDKIIGQAVCKSIEIELLLSKSSFTNTFNAEEEVIVYLGLKLTNITEYIPQGKFLIKNYTYDEDKGVLKLSCVDYMAETDKHTVSEITGLTYPITLDDYVTAICTLCGIIKSSKSYWGSNITLIQAPNFNGSESLREVLKDIAEMCLGNCYMNKSGELEISCIAEGTAQSITADDYFTASFSEKIIPINTVSLVRDPENDIVYAKDQAMIDETGVSDLIITNNAFMDHDRETFSTVLLAKVKELSFYPGEITWRGNPALDCFEKLTVTTADNGMVDTFLFCEELTFSGGLKSKITNKCSNKKVVEYAKGTTVKERVRNTEISVDKTNQRIDAVIENSYTKEQIDYEIQSGMSVTESNVKLYVDEKNELNSHTYTMVPDTYSKNDIFILDRDYITSQKHDFQAGQQLFATYNQTSDESQVYEFQNGDVYEFQDGTIFSLANFNFSKWDKKDKYQTEKDVSASLELTSEELRLDFQNGGLSSKVTFDENGMNMYDKDGKRTIGAESQTGKLQLTGDILNEEGNVLVGQNRGVLSTLVFSMNVKRIGITENGDTAAFQYLNAGFDVYIPDNFIVTKAVLRIITYPQYYQNVPYWSGQSSLPASGWGYPRNIKAYITSSPTKMAGYSFGNSWQDLFYNVQKNGDFVDKTNAFFGLASITPYVDQNWNYNSNSTDFATVYTSGDIKDCIPKGNSSIAFGASSLPLWDDQVYSLIQAQQTGYISAVLAVEGYTVISK